jgi:hypothetical protein
MFNDIKKIYIRSENLRATRKKLTDQRATRSQQLYNVTQQIRLAGRNRNYTLEVELKASAVAIEKELDDLHDQISKVQAELDPLEVKIEAYLNDSQRGTSEFKRSERAQKTYGSMEQHLRELNAKQRAVVTKRNEFKNRGASGNYGNAIDRIQRYDARVAELDDVVSSLDSEIKTIRKEMDTFLKNELAPASSALFQKEYAVREELMNAQ